MENVTLFFRFRWIIIGLFILVFISNGLSQAPDTQFTRTIGPYGSCGRSVQQTRDGGYIIGGSFSNNSAYFLKTDSNGDTLWTMTMPGGSTTSYIFNSVMEARNGEYYVVGTGLPYKGSRAFYARIDSSGYGGSEFGPLGESTYNSGEFIAQTNDGGVVVTGGTNTGGLTDIILAKFDSMGYHGVPHQAWSKTFGGENSDVGYCVRQTSDGGFIITGCTLSFGAGGEDVYLIKTNAIGDTLWTKTYGGTFNDEGRSVHQTADGGYAIAGYTQSTSGGSVNVFLIKTDSLGNTEWTKTFVGSESELGYSLDYTTDGGYIIMGFNGGSGMWLIKTDANGDTLWTRTVGSGYCTGFSIQQTSDDGYIMTGVEDGYVYLVKMAGLETIANKYIKGWNIISVPLTMLDFSKQALYSTSNSPAYAYEGIYVEKDTLKNGLGYWLKFESEDSVALTGGILLKDTINLIAGWNLIGSISDTVAVTSITSNPSDLVASNFFGYNGAYFITDTIIPGVGYWIKANQDGQLILDANATASAIAKNRIKIISTNVMPPPPPDEDGSHAVTIPQTYSLDQAFPNPFNPSTIIKYSLPQDSRVTLKVYNVLGQVMHVLTDEKQMAGYRSVEWNAGNVASGIYFYHLEATSIIDPSKSFTQVKKVILLK
jgi:hypothetical protein